MSSSPASHPLAARASTGSARLDALARLLDIIDRLREPDGCPWDREQTVRSMASSLTEEAFEAVEAIDRSDDSDTAEELGDLMLVVTLIARIASEEGRFDMTQVATVVGDKLIRRHPHVFGDVEVDGAEHVVENWERIKQAERAAKDADASVLAGVPVALPALQRIDRLNAKAIAAGFRWSDLAGAVAKHREEVRELEAELAAPEPDRARLEHELGDVLLASATLARYLKIDPEEAARHAARRYEARFRHMEKSLGADFENASLETMLAAWGRAKAALEPR